MTTPQRNAQSASTRDTALTQELSQLRKINSILSSFSTTIDKVHNDLILFNNGTSNAMIMMQKWSNIISQASFTQEMLNNTDWLPEDEDEENQDQEYFNEINDKNDDDEIELLSRKLMNYESENLILNKKIEKELENKKEKMKKIEEIANKRKRELGLIGNRNKIPKRW
ncbi:uncharacterized protein KGF55_003191 [Candida pseudojiufengensis]|uniref:uncharacterized protein n=1 Tax=Candida pseudojiufengensis TaxID=497109 RepID=UPI0022251363|nr:uncharacterized protein KGF55_003191 [Candida pseudojiufengensis]KAI5962115.1 hypothetical protein KGF55_003191 [Candida pseudojiufengensis]